MTSSRRVLCLFGPTAVGKTDIAIEIASQIPADLISVDSTLVYRGMDIGSAKPDEETLAAYPHQLVNIRDPADGFSAAEFLNEADAAVEEAFKRNRLPLLVGGTMLYFRAFRDGLADLPSANPKVRAEIQTRGEKQGWDVMHNELMEKDPIAGAQIHPNNHRRMVRALEVLQLSGRSLSSAWAEQQGAEERLKCHMIPVAVVPESRPLIHQRVERRFEAMLEHGFIDEVRSLMSQSHELLPAFRAVGYFEVWQYLNNEIGYDEMVDKAVAASRQLAKKQFTWLNDWPEVTRFTGTNVTDVAAQILQYMESVAIISGPLGKS